MTDWKTIETAPKNGKKVMLFWADEIFVGSYRLGVRGEPVQDTVGWRSSCCGRFGYPKHWQPLPESPK
jgi:hypothetical protein